MRSDAYIIITCDNCGYEVHITLTPLASGAYDERHVDMELERLGWNVDNDLCEDCKFIRV